MARLAVAAVLLTLVVVALCHFIDGEAVAASPNYANEPEPELAGPESNDAYNYNGVYSSAAVPADLDRSAGEEVPVVQSYDVPKAASPDMAVSPADGVDQGFLRLPSHMRQPCRHGDRHMWWARRHGLHRQDVYGFQGQEKKLVSEVPVEPATYGYGGETREWVALPVAEPDPDSRQDAAVALEEVRKPAFHGEQGDEDEMARAWRRFHHGRRHHHHQDEQEDDDHEQREEVLPVKRFRFHHDDGEEEKEMRSKRFHHHHYHDDDSDDELEEMALRWIRKALMRGRIHHHGRRFHHHLRFRHRAQDAGGEAAEEEEEKGGVVGWLKDFVNRF